MFLFAQVSPQQANEYAAQLRAEAQREREARALRQQVARRPRLSLRALFARLVLPVRPA